MIEEHIPQSDSIDVQTNPPSPRVPLIERLGISPVLFAFLSLIFIFILYQLVGGIITLLIFGMKPTSNNIYGYRLATGLGQVLFILIPTLILVRFVSFTPREYFRLKLPTFQTVIVPLVGIFSLQQVLQIYLIFQEKIPLPGNIQTMLEKFKTMFEEIYKQLVTTNSVPEFLWVVLIIALIPAVAEEFMFRGLIQRSFENATTPIRGVIITGIIFGAYHMNPFSFVPLVIIGIYLGFLTMRSGSILISVVIHFCNNLFACIALYLNMKDDYVVVGNAGDMSTGNLVLIFWFFGVIFILSTYYFLKITKPIKQTLSGDSVQSN
jgi:membrane protease YdiL (CAAX protease family)